VRLYEYQSKRLLAARGVPTPDGDVANSAPMAQLVAERLGGRVALKAQVPVGGRGKAGGVALANTVHQAGEIAARLLGSMLKGVPVRHLLVERAISIAQELYLGLALDRSARRMILMASALGGVDIEETALAHPERIHRQAIDPFLGLRTYQATAAAAAIGIPRDLWPAFRATALALYDLARDAEATLVEINPLVITQEGGLVALDAKITLDDSALFRHAGLLALRDPLEEPEPERRAREAGISYVKLDGRIGCMVNGAGLAMATMDVIKLYGGEPANFLDIGGGARAERVTAALNIILSDPDVAAVLINIFGGITRCDEVARGVVEALGQASRRVPLVVRLVGTNEAEGRRILEQAQLVAAKTLSEGARRAVAAAGGAL